MPSHRIEIFKSYSNHTWENVYLIQAGELTNLVEMAQALADMERVFHWTGVRFDYARISTYAAGDNNYTTVPLGVFGQKALSSNPLPLFVTARVDVLVVGSGRPSRKYYRGVLQEDDINFDVVIESKRQEIDTAINLLIAGTGEVPDVPLVDPQDQSWSAAVTAIKPQSRQEHRGSKRRAVV